ncbi:hypothetical protein DL98DRAFT_159840 [Cadophora sp. DSE1049]|nr:hypothetical protein DL98DRAFT_159840 [Cadophora sp. DSE1049]
MMSSGIEKQMKWQPSFKHGGKRWSYTAIVPSEADFYKLFNLKEEKKACKQNKIPLEAFERPTGELSASLWRIPQPYRMLDHYQWIRY